MDYVRQPHLLGEMSKEMISSNPKSTMSQKPCSVRVSRLYKQCMWRLKSRPATYHMSLNAGPGTCCVTDNPRFDAHNDPPSSVLVKSCVLVTEAPLTMQLSLSSGKCAISNVDHVVWAHLLLPSTPHDSVQPVPNLALGYLFRTP